MAPVVAFRAAGKSPTLARQTMNLERWWRRSEGKILEQLDYYVGVKWRIEKVEVVLRQVRGRNHALDCEGEVDVSKPDVITLYVGNKVKWTPGSLVVFVHELIHCATMSRRDLRFAKPGILENWIYDELAADLFAQHIIRRAGLKLKPDTLSSIEYAFLDVARNIVRSRQHKEERVKLVKEIDKKLRHYLNTEKKNYYSFRKTLRSL
jgi:hypothetical protein